MTLRERIAETMWAGLPYRWPDRTELLAIADAILDLPELRAIAAGETLYRRCPDCGGIGDIGQDSYAPCMGACNGENNGFVPVDTT